MAGRRQGARLLALGQGPCKLRGTTYWRSCGHRLGAAPCAERGGSKVLGELGLELPSRDGVHANGDVSSVVHPPPDKMFMLLLPLLLLMMLVLLMLLLRVLLSLFLMLWLRLLLLLLLLVMFSSSA